MSKEPPKEPAPEEPNLRLFVMLSPNVGKMARVTNLSRQTIYDILDKKHQAREDTVKAFNLYLTKLMALRVQRSRLVG